MSSEKLPKELRPDVADYAFPFAKFFASKFPPYGPILGEILGLIIPNQRMDRVCSFISEMNERIKNIRSDIWKDAQNDPAFLELLEDAARHSSRTASEKRIHELAALVTNGITENRNDLIKSQFLLRTLSEINAAEVILLEYYDGHKNDPAFVEKHAITLGIPPECIGPPVTVIRKDAYLKGYEKHLTNLGLLEPIYSRNKSDPVPQIDRRTGGNVVLDYDTTPLGNDLLRRIR